MNSTKLRVRPEEVVRQSVASKIQSKYINIVAFAFCQKSKLFGSCDIGLPIPPLLDTTGSCPSPGSSNGFGIA